MNGRRVSELSSSDSYGSILSVFVDSFAKFA